MTAQRTFALESIALVTASSDRTASGPILELNGTGTAPESLELVGPRLRMPGSVEPNAGEPGPHAGDTGSRTWRARVPLCTSRWGGPALPPPSGMYRFVADGAILDAAPPESAPASTVLPAPQLVAGLFRIAFRTTDAGMTVVFTPPLADDELGSENQARLEARYRSAPSAPEDAAFFESFYGQNASCNPLALDRALVRARPDTVRYWAVADASVAVPDGAIAVIEGSAAWWDARANARLIVINDWLRNRFHKRRHQTVVQTWHGTMLKKLALSRRRPGIRPALATLRERSRWDILLAQNEYAARIFRRAYAYLGPIWEEGYPRDDILVTGDAMAIRARLGIPNDVHVLLYAPTWRDDHPDRVDHLDVARFTEQLGPGYVTLIRGHSRTIQPGEDVRAGGVIDVTSYPDVSELFLAADALITDYSSVMFDFSVTGKPIYFFTPDLDRYRQVLRGFYFDLLAVAPGPVVQDPAELVRLVRDPDAVQDEFAARYAAWRERFNPHDDGGAAERVMARLIREGRI
ncbi:CDP-glycerol glycerophosphotransferase (TagB/SpsB family) [Cryobacterium mesophilum]|uniref:CDP-glycerol glycerophosphotransferase family protein n=1 Tax=Terrimesophilobacter mesophilus TaxID=433647 RepID=A0A4R8VEH6_9MICO|nr:CDP-glycerol glycerophosphotransferase family protein [Terrimesophilobacter mesophilus]MBB5633886.1 CDP-glycerol glycerophosphotransferase (TagB/SpsB family) [Terrimesophilobacter mesophilus]TFB80562.1 CDP-glycerol glycerophosphotransferase family protein [Terrimesophilobacter mesophilus]